MSLAPQEGGEGIGHTLGHIREKKDPNWDGGGGRTGEKGGIMQGLSSTRMKKNERSITRLGKRRTMSDHSYEQREDQ